MSTELMIYMVTSLDKVITLFKTLAITGGLAFFIVGVTYFVISISLSDYRDDSEQKKGMISVLKSIKGKYKKYIYAYAFVVISLVLVPNSGTLSAMYLIPKITDNEQVQEMPEKLLKVMNGHLDKWILDLSETNKEVK